jgi:retinol-binding protein 3
MTRRLAQALAMLVLFTPLGLVSAPQVHAQSATATPLEQVNIPNTPAGRALKAWLEAFNSGDRAQMDAYYQKYQPDKSAESIMPFRDMTGGFELIGIEKSERLQIQFRVKERNSETTAIGKLDVKDGQPPLVTSFILSAFPHGPSASVPNFDVDGATRSRVIDGAIENLNEYYVFPDIAKKMEDAVRGHQKRGEYDSVTDGDIFANVLTKHFQEVSHDIHLRVDFSPFRWPDGPPEADPDAIAQYRKQMERTNCEFKKVEHLSGNIGYLKFDEFADPEVCGPTAIAAMNFLANVDAIIIDLRENRGGDPKMIALLSTYLFSKQTHLNDLWERKTDTTQQYWTLPYVPGKRLDDKPVYVLTSKHTFSGAEEFSYNLKNLKRATIVGETTGGGAHPVSGHRIDDRFMIGVPFARAINPISKTNWEGVGVEPDVNVPSTEALSTAEKLAAEKLHSK